MLRFRALPRAVTGPLLFLWCCAPGCANLPDIEENHCGNAIVEKNAAEQCDGYAPEGQFCRPADSTVGACQFDCSTETETGTVRQCPTQYPACGTDGLCRIGSGHYVPWGDAVTTSASRLLLGDFDGDKRDDVVTLGNPSPQWQALPTLLFFDKDGKSAATFDPKMPIGSPQITTLGPIDGNAGPQQLLFSTDEGIASVSASAAKVVLPDAYPFQSLRSGSSYRVLPISGMSLNPLGDGILVFFGYAVDGKEITMLLGPESSTPIVTLPKPMGSLVGKLLAANVDSRLSSPCSEFLFAYQGERTVYALDPCNSAGEWKTWEGDLRAVVTLDEGHVIAQNLLTSDLNGDGLLDLTLGDESGQAYAAFGLGDGRFVGNNEQPEVTLGQALPLTISQPGSDETIRFPSFPLAIGDLNADGKNDWVLPDGILLTNALQVDPSGDSVNVVVHVGNTPFVGRWAIAQIEDFNRDHLLDLVAVASDEPDLDFFLGTGKERMNRFGLATEGTVTHLTAGDYDGDLTQDLAYAVAAEDKTSSNGDQSETVYIAFGNVSSAPTFTTAIGTFRNVRQLGSAHYVSTDAISELGVVSQPANAPGEELAVFIGNAGRHPIAPLGLSVVTAAAENYWGTPLAVTAGRFFDDTARDAIALGISCVENDCHSASTFRYRLWYAANNAGLGLSYPLVSPVLPNEFAPFLTSEYEFAFHLLAGNLDDLASAKKADQRDELLLLATHDSPHRQVTLWSVTLDSGLFSEDPDGEKTGHRALLGEPTSTPGTLISASTPTLIDLNQDGYQDLALLVSRDGSQNELLVAWNDGKGSLTLKDVTRVNLAGESPLGMYARTDQSGHARLVAITTDHVFERTAVDAGSKTLEFQRIVDIPGGKAIALGDLTGDGLLDLAISTEGSLRFYAEEPMQP